MKFSAFSCALFAILPVTWTSPLEARDSAAAGEIAGVAAPGSAQSPIYCTTTNTSAYTVDAQSLVRYLKGLPKSQACVTNIRDGSDDVAIYGEQGNAVFGGVMYNGACSNVTINCNTLGGYFQKIIKACSSKGFVSGGQYLPPNQWQLVKPGSCKKTSSEFAIKIIEYTS